MIGLVAVFKLSFDSFGCTFDDFIEVDESIWTKDNDREDWHNKLSADLIRQVSNDHSVAAIATGTW